MTRTIYQKRLQRDQFLREVYAGERGEAEERDEEEEAGVEDGDDRTGKANTTKKSHVKSSLRSQVKGKVDYSIPASSSSSLSSSSSSSSSSLSSSSPSSTKLPVLSPDHHSHGHTTHIVHKAAARVPAAGAKGSSDTGTRASSSTGVRASSCPITNAGGDGSAAVTVLAQPLVIPALQHLVNKEGEDEEEAAEAAAEAMLTRRLHHLVDVMQRDVEEEWCARYQKAVKELDQKLGE